VTVSAMKEQYSSDKATQMNISFVEATKLSEKWERVEMNRFYSALRPNSFREAKKAFDFCLEAGKNQRLFLLKDNFILFQVPKTKDKCSYVPDIMKCFTSNSPYYAKFWKKEKGVKFKFKLQYWKNQTMYKA